MSKTQELRDAYMKGAMRGRNLGRYAFSDFVSDVLADAATEYPAPTITRPRVVRVDNFLDYRVVDGIVEVNSGTGGNEARWRPSDSYDLRKPLVMHEVTPAGIAAIVELVKNPTETVEVDA